MYENITYALLLNRMLEKALSINNNLDTVSYTHLTLPTIA